MTAIRLVTLLCLTIALGACSHSAVQPEGTTSVAETGPTSDQTGSVSAPPQSASSALADQGRQYLLRGELEQASVTFERALRIEPGSAELWLQLGQVRLAEGQSEQAIALAEKALRMTVEDSLQEAAQLLIRKAETRRIVE